MQIELTEETDEITMRMSGRFDFASRDCFMEHAEKAIAAPSARQIEVDLSDLNYIDSAALGMLLLLRDKAKQRHKTVILRGPSGMVQQIVKTAQFDKLFVMR